MPPRALSDDDSVVWDWAIDIYIESFEQTRLNSVESSVNLIYEELTDDFDNIITAAMQHHEKHVDELGLQQGCIDIYKALSWLTWFSCIRYKDKQLQSWAIDAGLDALNEAISEDFSGTKLPLTTLDLLSACIKNEINDATEHGIAQNGLFLSFHSATEALKQSQNS